MKAYGAELVLVSSDGGMEAARDLAVDMQSRGEGRVLDQFANHDNPLAHHGTTGPEIWRQTDGRITHFVASMGTTGTIMGASEYLKGKNPDIQIIGVQPRDGAKIPGIRRWPQAYLQFQQIHLVAYDQFVGGWLARRVWRQLRLDDHWGCTPRRKWLQFVGCQTPIRLYRVRPQCRQWRR